MKNEAQIRILLLQQYLCTLTDEEHFQATVDVAPSPPFFAWVFTFGGKIHIIEKEEVATKMGEMARWL